MVSNELPDVDGNDNVTILRKPDGGIVYLLGTCHVSSTSASEAAELVRRVKPTEVVVELCDSRRHMLYDKIGESQLSIATSESNDGHSFADVAGMIGEVSQDWTSIISLQYKVLGELETASPGGEFRAAVDAAYAVGAHVILGDRRMELTQRRLQRLVPKTEMLWTLLFEDSEWVEKRAHRRYAEAGELQQASAALVRALAEPPNPAREARLHSLGAAISRHAEQARDHAVPGFADAVLTDLLRRFWCKELIGEAQVTAARCHRVPLISIEPRWMPGGAE